MVTTTKGILVGGTAGLTCLACMAGCTVAGTGRDVQGPGEAAVPVGGIFGAAGEYDDGRERRLFELHRSGLLVRCCFAAAE